MNNYSLEKVDVSYLGKLVVEKLLKMAVTHTEEIHKNARNAASMTE